MVSAAPGPAGRRPFDCSAGCGGGKAAARRFCVQRCAGEAAVGSARAPLQCGEGPPGRRAGGGAAAAKGPGGGGSRVHGPPPGDSVRADRASRSPPALAFYRSLHPWRGEGGSAKMGF